MPDITKTCEISGENFVVTEQEQLFIEKVSPTFQGQKATFLLPKHAHKQRQRQRFGLRNERNLYQRTCDLCKKQVVAMFDDSSPFPVYCTDCWWSDNWDAKTYGRNFDFNKTFFGNFADLQRDVPQIGLLGTNNENCDYVNIVGDSKNCYLLYGSIRCEDCLYGSPFYAKDCVDSLVVRHSELTYECTDCEKLYECSWCQNCSTSNNLMFCFDVSGCEYCFGCVGLRQKKFHIYNKQVTAEEYHTFIEALELGKPEVIEEIYRKLHEVKLTMPHRYMVGEQNQQVTGDYIWNSKNVVEGYASENCEDCWRICQVLDAKDIMDSEYGEEGELLYANAGFYGMQRSGFNVRCWSGIYDLWYSELCYQTKNSFGSISLQRDQYCILNKQYSKEDYEAMMVRIVDHMKKTGEWGEFFPLEQAIFGYNETVAQEYYPLTQEEAQAKGYNWKDDNRPHVEQTYEIPVQIADVTDNVLNDVLACTECHKNYRIVSAELDFLRRRNLPIPRKCPNCRYKRRFNLRNTWELWDRKCASCSTAIQTTYAPERQERVLCEKCYLEEVY